MLNDIDSINNEKIYKLNKERKNSKIKECFYFDHSECNNEIIKAHSIQENKVLDKISENGMVIGLDFSKLPFLNVKKIGKSSASIFTGFCKYHDMEIFKPIEIQDYKNTSLQNFLYSYRAFAKEAHTKKENLRLINNYSKNYPSDSQIYDTFQNMCLGLKKSLTEDFSFINEHFKNSFISQDYLNLITKSIVLNYEVRFALSATFYPKYDFVGRKINSLENKNNKPNIAFINIFPENGKTYLLFSWFKYSNTHLKRWFYQFLKLDNQQKFNYLNYFIPTETFNYYINPTLWNSWTEDARNEFCTYAKNCSSLSKIDVNKECLYNLFR